jgi:hypothetical protein
MATEPSGAPDAIKRLPRRPQHFAPYRLGRSVGLLHVHVVTEHFRIH